MVSDTGSKDEAALLLRGSPARSSPSAMIEATSTPVIIRATATPSCQGDPDKEAITSGMTVDVTPQIVRASALRGDEVNKKLSIPSIPLRSSLRVFTISLYTEEALLIDRLRDSSRPCMFASIPPRPTCTFDNGPGGS